MSELCVAHVRYHLRRQEADELRERYEGYDAPSDDEWLEALLLNPLTFELGELIPVPDYDRVGGHRRDHPNWMYVFFAGAIWVFGSAKKAARELGTMHRRMWLGQLLSQAYPDHPERRWPDKNMSRHNFGYLRDRYLISDDVHPVLRDLFEQTTAEHAREIGLAMQRRGGSFLNPVAERMFVIDGTTVPARSRYKAGDVKVERKTRKVLYQRRYDPDSTLYYSGDQRYATGVKHVIASIHGMDHPHHFLIAGIETMSDHDEAENADQLAERLYPHYPGVLGTVADGTYMGKSRQRHYQCGKHLISPQKVAKKGASSNGAGDQPKVAFIQEIELKLASSGQPERLNVYSVGGEVGVGEVAVDGSLNFTPAPAIDMDDQRNKNGGYRWYAKFQLPKAGRFSGETFTLRIDQDQESTKRGLNRPESIRTIHSSHPIFDVLYGRRSLAESVNSQLKARLAYGARSHSYTRRRQRFDVLAFALLKNSMALYQHQRWLERQAAKLAA